MADKQQRTVVLTIKGTKYLLAIDNIPVDAKFLVRQQTGFPWEAFQNSGGEDSLVVFWWMSRYLDGEKKLTFQKAMEQWSAMDLDIDNTDDVDFEMLDDGLPDAEPGTDSPQS